MTCLTHRVIDVLTGRHAPPRAVGHGVLDRPPLAELGRHLLEAGDVLSLADVGPDLVVGGVTPTPLLHLQQESLPVMTPARSKKLELGLITFIKVKLYKLSACQKIRGISSQRENLMIVESARTVGPSLIPEKIMFQEWIYFYVRSLL